MHGPLNIKFIDAKPAKDTYQYKNIKRKLCVMLHLVGNIPKGIFILQTTPTCFDTFLSSSESSKDVLR